MNFTILRFDTLESTNTEALNQAKKGAAEGLCVVADRQTSGRGRHGRVWVSEKNAGLYFSLILQPQTEMRFLPLITLMSAVAVFETLKNIGLNPDIKWVNDIHISGRKICGILAETTETAKGLAVVVGIGINLKSSNFPPEISEIATSVEAELGKICDREIVLEKLTHFLQIYYEILTGENGAEKIRSEWIARSSYAFGKSVKVSLENETIFGTTCGIEENGALRVETETGEIHVINAGDVENLRPQI
ncbi:MAG: biotin--[acetyl-CoA-carboxylase] ligase [Pyrinomonadaceae bacterium]|nr:biotin--[acetyl-CoA-carboxylase] ligase [Pyrinomonadaceae bacterium]